MRELLIATGNKGKYPEIITALGEIPFSIINLRDIGLPPGYEVEEPAMTFEGNAIIKAVSYGKKFGKLTLAEDAGLEVDALEGSPGVYSARYAPGTDKDRYEKLLRELINMPDEKLGAQYVAVVALYDPEIDKFRTCKGICRGRIIREPQGEGGFGYDPIFYFDELKKTKAQMTLEEKNEISHRGQAIRKAREILLSDFT